MILQSLVSSPSRNLEEPFTVFHFFNPFALRCSANISDLLWQQYVKVIWGWNRAAPLTWIAVIPKPNRTNRVLLLHGEGHYCVHFTEGSQRPKKDRGRGWLRDVLVLSPRSVMLQSRCQQFQCSMRKCNESNHRTPLSLPSLHSYKISWLIALADRPWRSVLEWVKSLCFFFS